MAWCRCSARAPSLTGSLGARRDTLGGTSPLIGNISADQRLLDSLLGPDSATLDYAQRQPDRPGHARHAELGQHRRHARARAPDPDRAAARRPAARVGAGSLSLAGGRGNFGGEITGQMIEVPGQTSRYSTLGAGVTWRTPWRGTLRSAPRTSSPRGKNPFGLPDARDAEEDEGRVPYVRYQQDL